MKKIVIIVAKKIASLLAVTIVIAVHLGFQNVRTNNPNSVPPLFCISFVLIVLCGYFIIGRLTQYSYNRYKKLTNTIFFLVCVNWGIFFTLPSIYSPYNWAWSFLIDVINIQFVRFLSKVLIIVGLLGLFTSIMWLGIPHSTGQMSNNLKTNGPYRFTRNPQIVAGGFIVLAIQFFVYPGIQADG